MRVLVVLVAFAVAVAQASPQLEQGAYDWTHLTTPTTRRPFIPVISRSEVRDESGQVALNYQSGDGTALSQSAVLKPSADGKRTVLVQQGTYSYTAPDGTPIQVSYIADETGFHPVGSHILTTDTVPAVPAHTVQSAPAPVPVQPVLVPVARTQTVHIIPAVPSPYHTNPYLPSGSPGHVMGSLPPGFTRLF